MLDAKYKLNCSRVLAPWENTRKVKELPVFENKPAQKGTSSCRQLDGAKGLSPSSSPEKRSRFYMEINNRGAEN